MSLLHVRPHRLLATAAVLALALPCLAASTAAAKKRSSLDAPTAASGLKEALSVGTGRAVDVLGVVDGYLKNDEVRIEPPKGLATLSKALSALGQKQLVDEFVTSMNRAAEAAAPLAKEVFIEAIKDMSFTDAVEIVKGKEHEATDYLKDSSSARLKELFLPIVSEKLEEVGATAAFDQLVARYATVPFASKPLVDLDAHVTDAALDGLFLMIAKEEERIRTDVVARSTDLLKQVFAQAGQGDGGSRKSWRDSLDSLKP